MASTTSFKQQCPSCEAMVPIRDPGLIGRKIDCPKCKYRFVVEKPKGKSRDDDDEEASGDTPAPTKKAKKPGAAASTNARGPARKGNVAAGKPKPKPAVRRRDEDDEDEDERPRKKKSGVSMTVLLGAGLGGLALILLIVGGWVVLSGGSGNSTSKSNNPPSGGSGTPMAQNPGPGAKAGPGDNKPSAASFIADVTNLLPNDAETVVNYQIDKLHDSGLGEAALAPGAFSETAFADTFSFPFYADGGKGVERVVTAISNTNHWVFTVLHAQKGVVIDKDKLIASLQLEAHPPLNGMIAYSVKRDLDALGTLLVKANRPHDDLQMVMLDGQTLVFADPAPMKKFLDDKGHPTLKSQPTEVAPPTRPNPGPGGSMTPPGPGGSVGAPSASSLPPPGGSGFPRPAGSIGAPSASSLPPPGGSGFPGPGGSMMPPGMGQPPASAPPAAAAQLVGSYLTIDPGMKAVFDRMEKSDEAILISAVLPSKDPLVGDFGRLVQGRAASWQTSKDTPSDDATRSLLDKLKVFRPQDVSASWIGFSLTAFSSDRIAGVVAVDMGSELLAKPFVALAQPIIASVNGVLTGSSQETTQPNGNGPPGVGPIGPPPGASFPPPGGSFRPGGSFPPSGSSFPPPGAGGSSPRSGGPRPGGSFGPGAGLPPMPGAGVPPMPGTGGSFGPGGNPADPSQGQGPLTLEQDRSLILLSASLAFGGEKAKAKVDEEIGQLVTRLKAAAETASSRSRIHELAAALQRYVQANGHFPRGAVKRERTPERFVEWSPNQRVSWMADLLPYIGDGEFANLPLDGKNASWCEGRNLRFASVLIPQFISHSDPTAPLLVQYPGVPLDVAVTNYVGVAGRGMDAVDYPAGDPRDGIFGYDRETKPADVKDGLDKTIALLQIPAGKTPWLAGGGATVRGVSEGPDALAQFVSADYQGRRGTFAVMGDFKVRFIPADIDPNRFVAMCTIAGGEKLDDIDQLAPVVPDDTPAAPPPVAPPEGGPDAPALDKPAAKPVEAANLPAGWKLFVSKEWGFAAGYPGNPSGNTTVEHGTGKATAAGFSAADDGVVYQVSCTLGKTEVTDAADIKKVYDQKADELSSKSTIKSRRDVTLQGHPGIEIVSEYTLGTTTYHDATRIFVVGKMTYQLLASDYPQSAGHAHLQKFLDSFQLLDGGAAPPDKAPDAPPAPPPPSQPLAGGPTIWLPFVDADSGFSVLMPNIAKGEKSAVKGADGETTFHRFKGEWPEGKGVFTAVVADLSPKVAEKGEAVAADWAAAVFGDMGYGVPLSNTKTQMGAYSGIDTTYAVEKTSDMVRIVNYVSKKRLYQLMVRVPKNELNAKEVKDFFNSFKLAGVAAPDKAPAPPGDKPDAPENKPVALPAAPPFKDAKEAEAALRKLGGEFRHPGDDYSKPADRITFELAPITDEKMPVVAEIVRAMPNVEGVDIPFSKVSDAGLACLKDLKQIKHLDMPLTNITDASMDTLETLPNLEFLNLGGTKVTDAGVAHLQSLTKLQWLNLSLCRVDDAGLAQLHPLTSLKYLRLGTNPITDAGIADLKKALPKLQVDFQK